MTDLTNVAAIDGFALAVREYLYGRGTRNSVIYALKDYECGL